MSSLKNTIDRWCRAHPALTDYCKQLNDHDVRWAVFAGSSVSLLTGNRVPTDIDLIVHDGDLEKTIALTPRAEQHLPFDADMPTGDGKMLHYRGNELTFQLDNCEVETMSHATTLVGDHLYNVSFTDLAVANRLTVEARSTIIYIANPFDTIAIKAIMQRGAEQNKFDFEDAKALIARGGIESGYARARAKEIRLDERAYNFLKRAGLKI